MSRVLIVEDDAWQAEQLARTLAEAGIDTVQVANGLEAIDWLDGEMPSVIILDLFLPGPNGLALLHELRSHGDIGGVPVIVCSASAENISLHDIKPYGVEAILDKTAMTPHDVVRTVRRVISGK